MSFYNCINFLVPMDTGETVLNSNVVPLNANKTCECSTDEENYINESFILLTLVTTQLLVMLL